MTPKGLSDMQWKTIGAELSDAEERVLDSFQHGSDIDPTWRLVLSPEQPYGPWVMLRAHTWFEARELLCRLLAVGGDIRSAQDVSHLVYPAE